jgi:hypothetical protein
MLLRLKFFKAFVDRHFTNFANAMDRLLRHVQVTLLTNKVDNARRDRVWRVLGDDLLCLDHVCDKQAQHRELLVDRQFATVTIDKGGGLGVV